MAVCVKWAVDPATVSVDPVRGAVWEQRVLHRVEPADLAALEQALRLREQWGGEVTVFTAGPPAADQALREAIAMGADSVLRVGWPVPEEAEPGALGRLLAGAIRPVQPDLVLCGEPEDGMGAGRVPAVIAEVLGLNAVTGVCALEVRSAGEPLRVTRRLERGEREILECDLPALLCVERDLCEPRYPGLPGALRAAGLAPPVADARPRAGAGPAGPEGAAQVRIGPARPRPRAIFTPDPKLPVWQRIEQILSAGAPRRAGIVREGPPEVLAEEIERYLAARGVL